MKHIALAAALCCALTAPAAAENFTVRITIQNGRFAPAEPHAPAGRPVTLIVRNLEKTTAEFESKSLRIEHEIAPGGEARIELEPLARGAYRFFDDYHEAIPQGRLVAD
ncbi:MAG: cupredoxin domain-containing protein [Hyphomicrobiales bacterium]|nr:cupredoxin domain-containing protein [Hyphomicrobiales bacterium]